MSNTEQLSAAPAATAGPGDEMLTKHELAAKLKVSVRCIENWQRAGHLPFLKIGSVVLFIWTDVVSHLKTHFQFHPLGVVRPGLGETTNTNEPSRK